jgi:hypothetical protein
LPALLIRGFWDGLGTACHLVADYPPYETENYVHINSVPMMQRIMYHACMPMC